MKRIVLVFGLISGLIVAGWMSITMALYYKNQELEHSMFLGYASMVIAFSLIFVAVKNYRDKIGGGFVSFGKAFRIGLYIALIGSTMYVAAWLVEYYLFFPDFMEKFVQTSITHFKASGRTAAEIADHQKQMDGYREMYKSPVMVVLWTYFEVLPVGVIVAVIAALVLKRKR